MSVAKSIARLEALGKISDAPDQLTRTFLSPANRQAAEMILTWMAGLGMETCHTVDGTLRTKSHRIATAARLALRYRD
jgi:allantoate deiminase